MRKQTAERKLEVIRAERRRRQEESQLHEGLESMRGRVGKATGGDIAPTETLEGAVIDATEAPAVLRKLKYVNKLLEATSKALDSI